MKPVQFQQGKALRLGKQTVTYLQDATMAHIRGGDKEPDSTLPCFTTLSRLLSCKDCPTEPEYPY